MAESSQLTAGMVIGGTYEAVHQIGRGGMGEVWLAKHLRVPKQVAIKVLHLRGAPLSEDALARFHRESQIAGRLGHPNIVEVHDYAQLPSGDPYLVLELLEGEPLSRRLKRGALGPDEARSVVRQVGSALQAAHHHGVVHRDLKPDNIFLVPSPLGGLRVKVLDFGISKIQDSSTVQTQEAVLIGTPQYMSPEQATGSNKDVGPQSDVFAMGAITYEMLCGAPAFTGESVAQLVFRVAYEPHPPLAPRVPPGTPPGMVAAVEHALVKDRALRTPDIATLVLEFTGEAITLLASLPAVSAPALAVVATPSLQISQSLGMADTAAPSSSGNTPGPASLATPTFEPVRVPVGPSTSSSAPQVVVAAAVRTSSTARRMVPVFIAVAAMLAIAVGAVVEHGPMSPPDLLESNKQKRPDPEVGNIPDPLPKDRVDDPPQVVVVPPVEPVKPVDPLVPRDPPRDPPRPQPSHAKLAVRDLAKIKDMEDFARAKGNQPINLEQVILRFRNLSDGVENEVALDKMRAAVAGAACHERDQKLFYIWRDRISTPAIKRGVVSVCDL